jgi:hypothetical protein
MEHPKFCRDCIFSRPEERSEWNLRCHNPNVMGQYAWALSDAKVRGPSCSDERKLSWYEFPKCGKAGKLYKNRLDSDPKL